MDTMVGPKVSFIRRFHVVAKLFYYFICVVQNQEGEARGTYFMGERLGLELLGKEQILRGSATTSLFC